jgi:hypothetical protein
LLLFAHAINDPIVLDGDAAQQTDLLGPFVALHSLSKFTRLLLER